MNKFLAVVFLFLASNAFAVTYSSYDNVFIRYQNNEIEASPVVEGVALGFSKSLGDTFFVDGDAAFLTGLGSGFDTFRLGVGAQTEWDRLVVPVNLYAKVNLLNADVRTQGFGSDSSYGYGVEAGARVQVDELFGARLGVASERYVSNSAFRTYALLGVTMSLTDSVALLFDGRLRGGVDQYSAGIQYEF